MNADEIVAEARSWIGTPYCHQASLKGVGADCLGLVRGVWRALYGGEPAPVPPYSPDWTRANTGDTLSDAAAQHLIEKAIADAQPGNVLLFRYRSQDPARHCAVLSAPDKIIHAYARRAVCETALVPWWRNRISGAFAFPETVPAHARLSTPSTGCDGA